MAPHHVEGIRVILPQNRKFSSGEQEVEALRAELEAEGYKNLYAIIEDHSRLFINGYKD